MGARDHPTYFCGVLLHLRRIRQFTSRPHRHGPNIQSLPAADEGGLGYYQLSVFHPILWGVDMVWIEVRLVVPYATGALQYALSGAPLSSKVDDPNRCSPDHTTGTRQLVAQCLHSDYRKTI